MPRRRPVRRRTVVALDTDDDGGGGDGGGGGGGGGTGLAVEDEVGPLVDSLAIRNELEHLSDRERVILHMRFTDELPQSEIARRLGISQVHVSRILSQTLRHLRSNLPR